MSCHITLVGGWKRMYASEYVSIITKIVVMCGDGASSVVLRKVSLGIRVSRIVCVRKVVYLIIITSEIRIKIIGMNINKIFIWRNVNKIFIWKNINKRFLLTD